MAYQYSKNLRVPFEEVLEKTTESLKQQGFTMIASMDIQSHIQREIGIKFRSYIVLAACVPELSYKAISLESRIGMILPCNIIIQEHENGQTEVSAINPMEALDKNMVTESLEKIAEEISIRLRASIDDLDIQKSAFSLSYN